MPLSPQSASRPDQAKVTAARTDIQAIATALEMYRLDTSSRYPSTQQGLEALSKRYWPGALQRKNWNPQGYLKSLPLDPWGMPYQYPNPGTRSTGYDLLSFGSDGMPGGEGYAADIGNWGD